jgi:hypothetical protein
LSKERTFANATVKALALMVKNLEESLKITYLEEDSDKTNAGEYVL